MVKQHTFSGDLEEYKNSGKRERRKWDREQIETIFNAYPWRRHPQSGKRAINAALWRLFDLRVPDPYQSLLEATKAFAVSPAGNQGQYTPHPATWYNDHCYEEDRRTWKLGKVAFPEPDAKHVEDQSQKRLSDAEQAQKEFERDQALARSIPDDLLPECLEAAVRANLAGAKRLPSDWIKKPGWLRLVLMAYDSRMKE